jgi:protein-tyrosine phosphatase
MIDLHFHLLPGIDDGPESTDAAVALAQAAADAGTQTIVATPHVSWRYPNDANTIRRLTDELRAHLLAAETPVEVLCGAEIAMTRIGDISAAELGELTIGAGPWLLVEPPFTASGAGLDAVVQDLQDAGHRVLLAHPERCQAFRRDPAALERLVRAGTLTSITAGSLVGDFGEEIRLFALGLARDGLAHSVASDAHDLARRPPLIIEHLQNAGLEPLAQWLTVDVPSSILSGDAIPPRPNVSLTSGDRSAGQPRPRGLGWLRRAS